jgi:hypothetical protein
MESTAIELQQKQNGLALLAEARSIKIVDQQSRELASSFSTKTRAANKTIDEWMNPQIEAANKTHKLLTGKRAELKRPFLEAQAIVDTEIGRDFMEQKRITAEAEARLRQEAEKQRLQAQEAIISQAIDQNDEGLLAEADNVFVPDIKLAEPERTTRTDFGSTNVRTEYAVECTDKMALIRHIAQSNLFSGYLEVDLAYAKRDINKNNWKDIPGLKITEVPKVSGRSK